MDYSQLRDKTIQDSGEQWTPSSENERYHASGSLFQDVLGNRINIEEIRDYTALDMGSRTVRNFNMLWKSDVKHVIAPEPSEVYSVILRNTIFLQEAGLENNH